MKHYWFGRAKWRGGLAVLSALSASSVLPAQASAQQYAEAAAPIMAADSVIQWWLGMLARRQYDASWDAAGPIFRAEWRKIDWETYCEHVEEQLVRASQRVVTGTQYWEDPEPLAGMSYTPSVRGKYVAVSYVTQIDRDKRVYERVTAAKYGESAWEILRFQLWPNEHGEPVVSVPTGAALPPGTGAPPPPATPSSGGRTVARPPAAPPRVR